jgi:hypothetical protein
MPADSRKPRRVPLKGSEKAAFTTGKRVGPAPKAEQVTDAAPAPPLPARVAL